MAELRKWILPRFLPVPMLMTLPSTMLTSLTNDAAGETNVLGATTPNETVSLSTTTRSTGATDKSTSEHTELPTPVVSYASTPDNRATTVATAIDTEPNVILPPSHQDLPPIVSPTVEDTNNAGFKVPHRQC